MHWDPSRLKTIWTLGMSGKACYNLKRVMLPHYQFLEFLTLQEFTQALAKAKSHDLIIIIGDSSATTVTRLRREFDCGNAAIFAYGDYSLNERIELFRSGIDGHLDSIDPAAMWKAQITSLERRLFSLSGIQMPEVYFEDVEVFKELRELKISSRPIKIGQKTFKVLSKLLETPERYVSNEQMMISIWGGDFDLSLLHVQFSLLRRILDGSKVELRSKRGFGTGIYKRF